MTSRNKGVGPTVLTKWLLSDRGDPKGKALPRPQKATGLPWGSTGITGNEWFTFLFSAGTFT